MRHYYYKEAMQLKASYVWIL